MSNGVVLPKRFSTSLYNEDLLPTPPPPPSPPPSTNADSLPQPQRTPPPTSFLESISARGTNSDPDPDELEDVVEDDDEEDFASEPDQDSSIHRFTAARLDPDSSSRSTKIKTEILKVKLEVGTARVSSISGLVLKDESTKITTDDVQTCGVYTAREEALKREVVALLLSRTVQRKLSDNATSTPSGDGELSPDGQFETQNGDNPGKESLDSQRTYLMENQF